MAGETLNVLTICGSLRKGSFNRKLMQLLPGLAPPEMKLTEAPPFAGFPLYNFDIQNEQGIPAEVNALAGAIRAADGLIVVSPEYNWSIPGGWKNAIDWMSRMKNQPFENKPVLIQSAAGGLLGGARMQYHLRQSLTSVDVLLFGRPEVIITFAAQKFDEAGNLKDDTARDLIKQQLAAFAKFIRRVKE
jgi:chromate reductase, NAD(P)H dehydrogenase (quinone)